MPLVTSKDGTKIAFEKIGTGMPVIIVSGALSHRKLIRSNPLVAMLSQQFLVYTYDRRGRGESSDMQPYAVSREIEDIDALIKDAGTPAYLYGVSSGAALALQAAAALGADKVPKLAIYEPPYGQEKESFDRQKKGVNERIKTGKPGDAAEFFMSAIGTPPEAIEGMKSSPAWESIKEIDFTLAYDYEVLGDGDVPQAVVKAITVPTLVMNGENGMDFMHPAADKIAHLLPNAQRRTLKGQTHQADAAIMAPVLTEFFASSSASATM